MKPYFYNISGTYTIVLPKIWSQNVTVSQILVLFILNLFSFYLQSILLAVFPNICLLILYLIFNNVIICKGSNDEKWTKFAQFQTYPSDYMSKFYPNLNLPFPGQLISIPPFHFKDSNYLNLGSNSNSDNFNCKSIINPNSSPLITTASNTLTTSSTNYVQPKVVASTVTTVTMSSCSPVPSVVSYSSPKSFEPSLKSVAPCISNVAKTTFSSSFPNTNFVPSEALPLNFNSSNTNTVCSSLPVSHSEPISCNFSKVFSETSHNVTPSKTFEISTQTDNQNSIQNNSFSLNKVFHNENILEKLSKLESVTLNSHEI